MVWIWEPWCCGWNFLPPWNVVGAGVFGREAPVLVSFPAVQIFLRVLSIGRGCLLVLRVFPGAGMCHGAAQGVIPPWRCPSVHAEPFPWPGWDLDKLPLSGLAHPC